jgi:hypothetical protein
MLTTHTHRRTVIAVIACALLASAFVGGAPAGASERTQAAAALAQERYYSSYGDSAAEEQERYYSSYGEPAPLTVAHSPEPSNDPQWLPMALSFGVALAIVAALATLARRLRIRRRAVRVTT